MLTLLLAAAAAVAEHAPPSSPPLPVPPSTPCLDAPRLSLGFDAPLSFESPLFYLTHTACAVGLDDVPASIALEVLVRSTKEYKLLRYHPSLVAATALYLVLRNQHPPRQWDAQLATHSGYSLEEVASCDEDFAFCKGTEIKCYSICSGQRQSKPIVAFLT